MEDGKVLVVEEALEDVEEEREFVDVPDVSVRGEAAKAVEVEELGVLLIVEVIVLFMEKVTELRNTPL